MRILIADDDTLFSNMVKDHLEGNGHKAETAANGKILFDKAVGNPPDLILMDVRMPEMDGATAQTMLRLNPKTSAVPIIVIAGRPEYIIENSVDIFFVEGVLSKPVNLAELDKMIENVKTKKRQAGGTA